MSTGAVTQSIRSTIPARLDRLSWSPFHTRMVAGLGAAWILDGLQITIARASLCCARSGVFGTHALRASASSMAF
jgi:hypothetical protein